MGINMRKRKEYLIPPEKRKNVIRLERRGSKKHKMTIGGMIFGVLAMLCLLYCVAIGLSGNFGSRFFLVWGALAVFLGAISLALNHKSWLEKLPVWLKITVSMLLMAGLLVFAFVEILILTQFYRQAPAGADYVIILGAQWKENGPSYVLKKRLDKAIEYLEDSPASKVVVTGGQGSNESIPEAEGMAGYLTQKGISTERILVENQSVNTYENLKFSARLLDKNNDSVVIVTSNFHVFRAVKIAEKQEYGNVKGTGADSHLLMLANNMLREFFGIVKDFLVGNL